MNTVSESELVSLNKSNAVHTLHIRQNERGHFEIFVSLYYREGELALATYRKTIREWVSLDRLAKHIRDHYGAMPSISLTLFSGENTS
jgi:hypothetical protein